MRSAAKANLNGSIRSFIRIKYYTTSAICRYDRSTVPEKCYDDNTTLLFHNTSQIYTLENCGAFSLENCGSEY
jgi:hypothetical protein